MKLGLLGTACALILPLPLSSAMPSPWESQAPLAESALAKRGAKKGALFSALGFAETELGRRWQGLRTEAQRRFPTLKLKRREDLHATVVFLGGGWKVEQLGRIRTLALVGPRTLVQLRPEAVQMGRQGRVVALELHGETQAWTEAVLAAKAELARLGLRKADAYEGSFRLHVTLAEAGSTPPSEAEQFELKAFLAWIGPKLGADFSLSLGPEAAVQLWLAGASRPEGGSDYLSVEAFLDGQLGLSPPPEGR